MSPELPEVTKEFIMRNNRIVKEIQVPQIMDSDEIDLVITSEQDLIMEEVPPQSVKSPIAAKSQKSTKNKRSHESVTSPKSEIFNSFFRATQVSL